MLSMLQNVNNLAQPKSITYQPDDFFTAGCHILLEVRSWAGGGYNKTWDNSKFFSFTPCEEFTPYLSIKDKL